MRLFALASVSAALIISGAAAQNAAPQVTIFTTKDFHQDRALWSNPAYYRNNTPGQLQGMALNIVPYETGGQVGGARQKRKRYGDPDIAPSTPGTKEKLCNTR